MQYHSDSPEIGIGTPILVTDSVGRQHRKIATSAICAGLDGPVVWACRSEDWDVASAAGREPVSVPWPAEDVEAADV